MKILMLSSSFPRYEGDFFGPWVLEYIRALKRKGHQVVLVAPVAEDNDLNVLSEEGLQIERFNYFFPKKWQKLVYPPGIIPQIKGNFLRLIQVPFLLLAYYLKVNSILKKNKFDILPSQWVIPSGYIGSFFAGTLNIPHFITSQGAEFFLPINHPFSFFTKRTLKKCDILFPVSNQMKEKAIEFGIAPEKVVVVPNTVNTNIFKPNIESNFKTENDIPQDAKIILTIRRLVFEKRVEDVIEAFAQLNPANTFLVIGGDGPDKEKLIALCKTLNVISKVRFLGFVNNKELPPIYAASDIYILSSQQEGLSLSLLESMASELITISTGNTGGTDVIKHGENGFLYEVANVNALSDCLNNALQLDDNQLLKIKESSRKTIVEKFSVDYMVDLWEDNYRKFLV